MRTALGLACAILLIAISRAGGAPNAASTQPARDVAKDLERVLPEISFDRVGLSDCMDFLADVSGANILVNWSAIEKFKIDRNAPATFAAKKIKFGDALHRILASVNPQLDFQAEGRILVISTRADLARKERVELDPRGKNVEANAKTKALLDEVLPEVQFNAVGITDVVDFLRDVKHVKIEVDWDSLEKAGVDKRRPVTMRLHQVKLSEAIYWTLREIDGSEPIQFAVRDGVIRIASKSTFEASDAGLLKK